MKNKIRTLKADENTIDPRMSVAIRKYNFHTLWKNNAGWAQLFECCNKVRKYCNLPPYSHEQFDHGWQSRLVMHESYKTARDEFFNLCFGWW